MANLSPPLLTDQQRSDLIAHCAAADEVGFEPEQLAALIGAPLPTLAAALNDPALVAKIETARLKATLDGSLLKPKAIAIIDASLPKLRKAIDGDELDPGEVADVMTKALRIVERQDRVDTQAGDKRRYATVFINFGPGGLIVDARPTTTTRANTVIDADNVIDAEPKSERSNDDE